jgi:hypothetical protein
MQTCVEQFPDGIDSNPVRIGSILEEIVQVHEIHAWRAVDTGQVPRGDAAFLAGTRPVGPKKGDRSPLQDSSQVRADRAAAPSTLSLYLIVNDPISSDASAPICRTVWAARARLLGSSRLLKKAT